VWGDRLTIINRYLTHAVVLALVVIASGYASAGHHSRIGAVTSSADAAYFGPGDPDLGDAASTFYLGRWNTIIKPLAVPATAPPSHAPIVYAVGPGEDLKAVAAKFQVSSDDLRWSNPILHDTDQVTVGERLTVPPLPGVVVATHQGDSVGTLSATYGVDADTIVEYNRLRADPSSLPDGLELVIPGGHGPPLPAPAIVAPFSSVSDHHAMAIRTGAPVGTYSNDRFPWGWCTWYVATRRNVTWLGDAYQWYGNAAAQGFPVGQTPQVGAVMVTWESGWGHVAYVEAVYSDGSWLVSEMNFSGFGVTDQRQIYPGQVPLIGFVYDRPAS
jgi:surface antigen